MRTLVTRAVLGQRLGCDPRKAAKKHKPVAMLLLGDSPVPLYDLNELPDKQD
jgi:hypothetical protein